MVRKSRNCPKFATPAYIGRIQRLIDEVARKLAQQFDVAPEQVVVICVRFPMLTTTVPVSYFHALEVYNYLNLIRQDIIDLKDPIFDQVGMECQIPALSDIRKLAQHYQITQHTAKRLWRFVSRVRELTPNTSIGNQNAVLHRRCDQHQ